MNIIRKLSLRSMKKNRTTTLVTILGIIMSIALMTGLFLFSNSLLAFMRDEIIIRNGDTHVIVSDTTSDYLNQIPNQELASKRTLVSLMGVIPSEEEPMYRYSAVYGYNPKDKLSVPLKLDQGRLPEKPGEIVITTSINRDPDKQLSLGQSVTLEPRQISDYHMSEDFTIDKTPSAVIEGKIVGITNSTPLQYPHYQPAYFVYQTKEEIKQSPRVWAGFVIKDLNGERLEQFIKGIDQTIAPFGVTNLVEYYPNVPSRIRTYGFGFAMVLAVIVGLAGISLIQNGFMISLSQRLRELSVLSSVGMTRRQKWQMSLTEGLSMFLVGLPLGIFFGSVAMVILFRVLTPLLQRLIETEAVIRLTWDVKTMGVIVLLSFITLLIASFVPALKTSRQTPLAGVRQQEDFSVKSGAFKSPRIISHLFGFEGDLAWKNLKRNKRRYRSTLVALVLSLVLYLAMASVIHFANFANTIAETRGRDDIQIGASGYENYQNRHLIESMQQAEGVETGRLTYSSYGYTFAPVSELAPELTQGEEARPPGDDPQADQNKKMVSVEILSFDKAQLNKLYSEWKVNPEDLKDGQAIMINQYRLKDDEGKYRQKEIYTTVPSTLDVVLNSTDTEVTVNVPIVKTINEPLENYESWYPAIKLIVSQETMDTFAKTNSIDMQLRIIAKNRDYSELTTKLKSIIDENKLDYYLTDYQGTYQRERDFLLVARILFFGFATIIALISLANIYNSLISSLRYRRKEFAMLRSVGMEEASFRKMIRFESYFYAGKLLLYALPFGVLVSYLIYRYLIRTIEFSFHIPIVHFAIATLVVVVALLLIMNLGSKNARRGNILETLKLEMDL